MNWTEDICIFYKSLPTFNPQMRTDGVFTGKKVQRCNHDRSNGTLGCTGEKKNYVHEGNNGLFYPKSVLEYSNVNHGVVHPTQKPVEIILSYIQLSSNEGDVVLDPFIGSGTTAIACVMANRRYIGFEINKDYYDSALRRIKIEQSQLKLF